MTHRPRELLLAVLLAVSVFHSPVTPAQDAGDVVTVTWDPPTERANGDTLDPEKDIDKYTVYCRNPEDPWPEDGYEIEGYVDEGYHETLYVDLLPGPGKYQCAITATDTEGLESSRGDTDTVEYYVEPEAPTNLKIGF